MSCSIAAKYSTMGWNGAATLVRGQPTSISSIMLHNEGAATRYIQMFDAAAVADVTLGTTAPSVSFVMTTDTNLSVTFEHPLDFGTGLVIAATTTARGATTGGTINVTLGI